MSVYGILSTVEVSNEKLMFRVLCLHGRDDLAVPPEQVLYF